jgi:DNA-binding beta-propeller fold protein YncE
LSADRSPIGWHNHPKMERAAMKTPVLLLALAFGVLAARPGVAADYAVTDRIKIDDGGFDYASFDPVHRRLYVSRVGGVLAMDVDKKALTEKLTPAQRTHESLPLEKGKLLLITDSGTNSAHIVDALTGKAVADVATGKKPDAAIFDPATGLAIVMNGQSGDVTLIDPKTKAAVGSIAIGGALEFAASDGAGKVFVNIEDQGKIAVLDVKARKLLGKYDMKGCEEPSGLAYVPGDGLLISACASQVAKVLKASTGEEVASLTIGRGPDAVIYDADRHLAFIPCGRDGVLEVIAVKGPKDVAVVQTVKTQPGARTGAVDPKTGVLYLPTAAYTLAAGGRPTPTPGTFAILVVAPK